MLKSPFKSPTVRALGVTVTTFAVLGGASVVVTSGVTTVVRFGLKLQRVGIVLVKAAMSSLAFCHHMQLDIAEETCCSLSHMPQEGYQKLSNLQRCASVYK